jgi:hypothetical protein
VAHRTEEEKPTVLVLGGNGGLEHRYRTAVEDKGYELKYFEKQVPSKYRRNLGKVAVVVVMVNMMSHTLLEHAREVASRGADIVYLKSASASALRDAVGRHSGTRDGGDGERS